VLGTAIAGLAGAGSTGDTTSKTQEAAA